MAELAAYLGIGIVVGFLSGLLGIGGGVIIVSALALMFAAHDFPPQYVMHLSIATSMACIVFGSWSSFRTHQRHDAVDWGVVKGVTPGLIVGVAAGVMVARGANTTFLKFFFLGVTLVVTAQMALNLRPAAGRALPGRTGLAVFGLVMGVVASLFGGGGAAIGVPVLTWCNMTMHRAIGTVAALAFPIAIAGTLGYIAAGWSVPGLPSWSLGFVYLPAFAGIAATSVVTARWGARLAHRLKGTTLRRIFALVLVSLAVKMAFSV